MLLGEQVGEEIVESVGVERDKDKDDGLNKLKFVGGTRAESVVG